MSGASKYTGMVQATKDIFREEGFRVCLFEHFPSLKTFFRSVVSLGGWLQEYCSSLFLMFFLYFVFSQGFWRGNVPALLMVMPYTSIQFTVLHKLKSFASGSTKTGNIL